MSGFFEGLVRMIKGEPVFRPEEDNDIKPARNTFDDNPVIVAPVAVEPRSQRTDGKIAPIVIIERVECDIDGQHMELEVRIKNTHSAEVFLDKILLLGTKWELDRTLRAGEEREFRVYHGPRPANTHMTKCEVHYRDVQGDYFSAIHFVEFRQLQDGMYVVSEIRFLPPVKDI